MADKPTSFAERQAERAATLSHAVATQVVAELEELKTWVTEQASRNSYQLGQRVIDQIQKRISAYGGGQSDGDE